MPKKTSTKINIGILGFGNMGKAIFKLLSTESIFKFYYHDKLKTSQKNIKYLSNPEDLIAKSDIIFLSIKPQDFKKFQKIPKDIAKNKIIISIMVGIKIKDLSKIFEQAKVIRIMPNMNLQVGFGATGWYTKNKLQAHEEKILNYIFDKFGYSIQVNNENQINAITAISGSGPAYAYLFIDSLIKSAEKLGFQKNTAERLVIQTILGSVAYKVNSNSDYDELIKKITSKGGTTETALKSINTKKYKDNWQKATKKAYERAKELSA